MVDVEFLCADGSLICTDGAFLALGTTLLSLITDRTQRDVDRVEELAKKGWAAMTEQERAEWLGELKGAYNASDMNRVGEAVAYVAGRFNGFGYNIQVSPKTDWTVEDIPTASQMADYLSYVKALRNAVPVRNDTPAAPADMDGLTHQEANDIEQILLDVDALIFNIAAAWYYSGDLFTGEV